MFPVNSTSLETKRIARAIRVAQRRPYILKHVTSAGVYNCRKTVGTTLWSAHAVGDAVDLMCGSAEESLEIAKRIVADATSKTAANLRRPTEVYFVIGGSRQWVRGHGWSDYPGVPHTNHCHVAGSGSFSSSTFDCGDKLPGVAYVK